MEIERLGERSDVHCLKKKSVKWDTILMRLLEIPR